jgi:hypothetical protein
MVVAAAGDGRLGGTKSSRGMGDASWNGQGMMSAHTRESLHASGRVAWTCSMKVDERGGAEECPYSPNEGGCNGAASGESRAVQERTYG